MEERILNALAGSPGKSAKEVARELGEATPIIMEHLLGLAASGALKQRTVGREQVFSIPRAGGLPTPREITTGSWTQRVPAAPEAVAVLPEPTPAPVPPVDELPSQDITDWAAGHRKLVPVPNLRFAQQYGRIARQPVAILDFDTDAVLPSGAWQLQRIWPKPTLYDRIGGTITLEIDDSPIKARFQSVEQLHRFLTELIENERAAQKGGAA